MTPVPATVGSDVRGRAPSFESFRRWALSDDFPETGRHDYIGGRYVEESEPEPLFSHNAVKGEIAAMLMSLIGDDGLLTMTRGRVTVPMSELAVQPDIALIASESLDQGRVTLTPHPDRPDDAIEVVGPPDLVVEVVSDESVLRDTRDLFDLYLRAGVREYWLVDARNLEPVFRLLANGRSEWGEIAPDREGFRRSPVLGRRYRLDRRTGRRGEWRYDLIEREPS
ncbi:MAG TPA: Uma2 family endonuclease [Planctomycetaceae bacterium]